MHSGSNIKPIQPPRVIDCQSRIGERGHRQAVHADDGYIVRYAQSS